MGNFSGRATAGSEPGDVRMGPVLHRCEVWLWGSGNCGTLGADTICSVLRERITVLASSKQQQER